MPSSDDAHGRLPTGARLDPAGTSVDAGNLPLALALSPNGNDAVLLLSGFHEQGVQVIDRSRGKVASAFPLPGAFIGLAFSPDGKTLAASGGNADAVYLFTWRDGRVWLTDSILLAKKAGPDGTRYPAGIAWSRSGSLLYVVENLADSLAVVNVGNKQVMQRLATERYPYGVVVGADGGVYVSAWGGTTVSAFIDGGGGALTPVGRITVGRHPSAMALSADGSRLFVASASTDRVAVVDTRRREVIAQLLDPPPAGPGEGSTPNAVALSTDGTRLFVAEADNNAVAVFDLSPATSGVRNASGRDALAGRIPVGWYPSALAVRGDTLFVVNAKGRGTLPNPGGPRPGVTRFIVPLQSTLGMLNGTLTTVAGAMGDSLALALLSARVAHANGWDTPARTAAHYPPFEHVIYVIKENRTFDQVLSDMPNADGDTALLFFPRAASPNHHALAGRFGTYDRFFVNAEVSADGHNWSNAAYAADYVEKTVGLDYGNQGRYYDYEGSNRGWGNIPDDDVNEPASGYLWNAAQRAGVTYRDYGEFALRDTIRRGTPRAPYYFGSKKVLDGHVDSAYPGFNMRIRDQVRVDRFLDEFREFERTGVMPALVTMNLPNDHTSGLLAGAPTPRAAFADNDLALGRLVEALSRSVFWKNTVVFVVEDDAQNGPDHVDSHRSVMFAISAYSRGGVRHRFANTSDVLATIIEVLHLGSLSQFDFYGRPLRDVFTDSADMAPYAAIVPAVDLGELNPPGSKDAASRSGRPLDLAAADRADEDDFNRELWLALKGAGVPYPGIRRMSALEAARSR